ncbi:hypothetical protein PSTG_13175 [Puccinia striiformis f. sp. tritici PST-78]|uniref:Uncharacterized protein n=1 Tax=Puccinia striiformis f. sp. tritici PST-78 TaxID=1165861 RepID=A0A0L0V2D5_9BASI|nr:hypothetical protein PSTG_13175 [Puccinia striiformis f. sp. tritici PST-78]
MHGRRPTELIYWGESSTDWPKVGDVNLEALPLNFVCLSKSHSGEYLAGTVALVVEKFGIQDKICGIIQRDTSMDLMLCPHRKFDRPVHPLSVRNSQGQQGQASGGSVIRSGEESDHAEYDDAKQIQLLTHGDQSSPSTYEDLSNTESLLLQPDDKDSDSLSEDFAQERASGSAHRGGLSSGQCFVRPRSGGPGSAASPPLPSAPSCSNYLSPLLEVDHPSVRQYPSQIPRYFHMVTKKLKYSPNYKAKFVRLCLAKKCLQLSSIVRCQAAIIEWQRHKTLGIERKYHLDQLDLDLARDLGGVLNLFREITLQISVAGSAQLSNIASFIDQITKHLSTVISNPSYPAA